MWSPREDTPSGVTGCPFQCSGMSPGCPGDQKPCDRQALTYNESVLQACVQRPFLKKEVLSGRMLYTKLVGIAYSAEMVLGPAGRHDRKLSRAHWSVPDLETKILF